MSSLARKMARAKQRKAGNPNKGWNGLTSSFSSVDELRAQMAVEAHKPTMHRDRSTEAAQQIAGAMDRARKRDGYTTPEGAHMSQAYIDNLQTDKPVGTGKGIKGENCNRSACQAPGAYWYNHSTQAYYCGTCADLINSANRNDPYVRDLGHDLLTLDPDFADKRFERA